ncbi:hypothetical protein Tco_0864145 [Tanacetum coccineum]
MECKVGTLMKKGVSPMGRSESVFGMSSNMMRQLPPEPSRLEAFEDLVINFILDQEERVKQLKEYIGVIGSDFMQLSLKVVEKLKDEIRAKENKVKKIKKITSTSKVLLSFEENTPPVTYPDEVEEIIGIPIEVEPLDETPLEDLGLNTGNHDILLSLREIPSLDEPEPQPQQLDPRKDINRGVNNFTGRIKGVHVFVGNFIYAIYFMIIKDISSIIDPRLSQVVLGKPFVKISNMTHDPPEGVVRFTNGTDNIAYKMPHKIEQYNSLSDLEREHTNSVYLRNEEDKRRGVEYVMSKILGFYKECLELRPEYLTGITDEGEVT